MAGVIKRGGVYQFWYKDYAGRRKWGTGWPDKRKTLEHAQDLEGDHRAIRKGEKPRPPRNGKGLNQPITEVVADYLAWGRAQGGRGGRPWAKRHGDQKAVLLNWWIDELGLGVLGDIELDPVEGAIQELLNATDLAPKTVALRAEALHSLCEWAVRRRRIPANPLAQLSKIDTSPVCPHRGLTDEEVVKVLRAAPPHRRLWYETDLATGYRVGELRAVRVGDLDLFGPSLPLGAEYTKNRKDARQPITRDLADRLKALAKNKPADAPLLGIHTSKAWRVLKKDLLAAGVALETVEGRATWHSFRKYYVDFIEQAGTDMKTLLELARHSTASLSLDVYTRRRPARLRAAAEAVSQHIHEITADPACCAGVARLAVGAEGDPVTPSHTNGCGEKKLVGATGFEPATS